MKQYYITWHFYSKQTDRVVLVEEYGFARYAKKRMTALKSQKQVIDVKVFPTYNRFFDCLFHTTIYH